MNEWLPYLLAPAFAVAGFALGVRWRRKRELDYYREKRWLRKLSMSDRVITASANEGELVSVSQVRSARIARRQRVDL